MVPTRASSWYQHLSVTKTHQRSEQVTRILYEIYSTAQCRCQVVSRFPRGPLGILTVQSLSSLRWLSYRWEAGIWTRSRYISCFSWELDLVLLALVRSLGVSSSASSLDRRS